MMVSGVVLEYPGSVENYSAYKANNLKLQEAQEAAGEKPVEEQAEQVLKNGLAAGEVPGQSPSAVSGVAQPEASAQELYDETVKEPSGSRAVYESLLMRENVNTGTTEANVQLARIKIDANVKDEEERAGRDVFFDSTLLAQAVKNDRDFLTGRQVVGGNFDVVE